MSMNVITRENFALLKSCLLTIWPSVKSSHADEVIAAYYGFRTYAALRSALPTETATLTLECQPNALFVRLESLGYRMPEHQLERIQRLFQAETIGRIGNNFRRMPADTANDNAP